MLAKWKDNRRTRGDSAQLERARYLLKDEWQTPYDDIVGDYVHISKIFTGRGFRYETSEGVDKGIVATMLDQEGVTDGELLREKVECKINRCWSVVSSFPRKLGADRPATVREYYCAKWCLWAWRRARAVMVIDSYVGATPKPRVGTKSDDKKAIDDFVDQELEGDVPQLVRQKMMEYKDGRVIEQPECEMPAEMQHIVKLDGLQLSQLRLVPGLRQRFVTKWAIANAVVGQWITTARAKSNAKAYEWAIKWFMNLPILLLRRNPKSRGRRRVRSGTMSDRFEAFTNGNLDLLVKWVIRDYSRQVEETKGRQRIRLDPMRRVKQLVCAGDLGRARRMLMSKGIQDTDTVLEQLNQKHPLRKATVPPTPRQKGCPLLRVSLKERYRKLKANAGPGPDGYRNEYLTVLARKFNDAKADGALAAHEEVAFLFLNDQLPSWVYERLAGTRMVAIIKAWKDDGSPPDVRPIAISSCLTRAWVAQIVADVTPVVTSQLSSAGQVAIGVRSGLEKVVKAITAHLDQHQDHVAISLDYRNAFNEVKRSQVIASMVRSEARALVPLFGALYRPHAEIVGITRKSSEGVRQGDPIAAMAFCYAIHDSLAQANRHIQAVGGKVMFYVDDGYIVGPKEEAFEAAKLLETQLRSQCGIEVQPAKCQVYAPNEKELVEYMQSHSTGYRVGRDADGNHGIVVAGIPIGKPEYVARHLAAKTTEICECIKQIRNKLQDWSKQALIAMLMYCCAPMMNYEMRNIEPWVMAPHLKHVDDALREAASVATGVTFEGPEAPFLAKERLELPKVKKGGGIRRQQLVAYAAYVGGLLASVPHLVNQTNADGMIIEYGVHNVVGENLLGKGFGKRGTREPPFRHMIQNGSPMGKRLKRAWDFLRHYTGEDGGPVLDAQAESAGCNPDGESVYRDRMQKELTDALDMANFVKVDERMKMLARDNRMRMCWTSINHFSWQFIGSIPYNERTVMSNRHLQMAYETYYGDKCKQAAHLFNEEISAVQVSRPAVPCDEYGDLIASRSSSKFTYQRHDSLKFTMKMLLDEAGVDNVCEPNDLFTAYVRQNDERNSGTRRALRPDFVTTVGGKQTLWDVKTVSKCNTWYKVEGDRNRDSAVLRRQKNVNTEYQANARKADRRTYSENHGGSAAPPMYRGAVCAELDTYGEVRGLVAGAFGEMSPDVDRLVSLIAMKKARQWQLQGALSEDHARANAKRAATRDLGIEAARGYAILKDGRIRSLTVRRILGRPSQAPDLTSQRVWGRQRLRYYNEHIGRGVEGSFGASQRASGHFSAW